MELEFDKEIDAILRKGRGGVAASAPASEHLDADVIAAFVENVLPQRSRALYTTHLADCDRCRTQLAFAASLDADEPEQAALVAAPAKAAAVDSVPWYRSLVKAPNLALAMGALVLTFGGILGYQVLRSSQLETNSTVSQVTNQDEIRGGGATSGGMNVGTTNSDASASSTAANAAALATPTTATTNGNSTFTGGVPSSAAPAGGSVERKEKDLADSLAKAEASKERSAAKPVVAAPPPPPAVTMEGLATTDAQKKGEDSDKAKDDKELGLSRKRSAATRRDLPAAAAKSGPARSGPLQNQTNQANQTFEMPVTRVVSGKQFNNRDGAWYDSSYRGQATQNYRRGTDEYRKLDGGLRKIADTIGGTVVLVWKGKAYRIN